MQFLGERFYHRFLAAMEQRVRQSVFIQPGDNDCSGHADLDTILEAYDSMVWYILSWYPEFVCLLEHLLSDTGSVGGNVRWRRPMPSVITTSAAAHLQSGEGCIPEVPCKRSV